MFVSFDTKTQNHCFYLLTNRNFHFYFCPYFLLPSFYSYLQQQQQKTMYCIISHHMHAAIHAPHRINQNRFVCFNKSLTHWKTIHSIIMMSHTQPNYNNHTIHEPSDKMISMKIKCEKCDQLITIQDVKIMVSHGVFIQGKKTEKKQQKINYFYCFDRFTQIRIKEDLSRRMATTTTVSISRHFKNKIFYFNFFFFKLKL